MRLASGWRSPSKASHDRASLAQRHRTALRRRTVADRRRVAGAGAEINEAVASEFAEKAVSPLENPLIARLAQLGVQTDAAVSVALQRAHGITFYTRRGRTPRDAAELSSDARELSDDQRAQVTAVAVAWWDGVLTALRAHELRHHAQDR